jgi:prepilin-type N-terminal cleavage/methylation domain-containing protein/prepilin-type processing-associated H-X9-DG protein
MTANLSGRRQYRARRAAGRAFTLIELLVVIGIIALLVSLLLPSLNRAKDLARRGVCQTRLRAVAVGLRMYLDQSNEVMPVAAQLPSAQLNDDPPIAEVLRPHLSSDKTLRCPADPDAGYFRTEGSSYEYNSMLGGRKVADSFMTQRLGASNTPVMWDYRPFHGRPGTPGAATYLFADCHVGDLN